jgi:hypothetical protein
MQNRLFARPAYIRTLALSITNKALELQTLLRGVSGMGKGRTQRARNGVQTQLAALMRAAVDARACLGRTRERLRDIEQKLRRMDPDAWGRKRAKALGDYVEAVGKARLARMELLKRLREQAA